MGEGGEGRGLGGGSHVGLGRVEISIRKTRIGQGRVLKKTNISGNWLRHEEGGRE